MSRAKYSSLGIQSSAFRIGKTDKWNWEVGKCNQLASNKKKHITNLTNTNLITSSKQTTNQNR